MIHKIDKDVLLAYEKASQCVIKKTSQGQQVVSKSGKPLSKPNLSKSEAKARLRQVEYYKNKK